MPDAEFANLPTSRLGRWWRSTLGFQPPRGASRRGESLRTILIAATLGTPIILGINGAAFDGPALILDLVLTVMAILGWLTYSIISRRTDGLGLVAFVYGWFWIHSGVIDLDPGRTVRRCVGFLAFAALLGIVGRVYARRNLGPRRQFRHGSIPPAYNGQAGIDSTTIRQ
jgi:hypothetical protein